MNVVNKREDSLSFLCQNALLASSLENTLDLDNLPIVNSTDDKGYVRLK